MRVIFPISVFHLMVKRLVRLELLALRCLELFLEAVIFLFPTLTAVDATGTSWSVLGHVIVQQKQRFGVSQIYFFSSQGVFKLLPDLLVQIVFPQVQLKIVP